MEVLRPGKESGDKSPRKKFRCKTPIKIQETNCLKNLYYYYYTISYPSCYRYDYLKQIFYHNYCCYSSNITIILYILIIELYLHLFFSQIQREIFFI